MSLYDDIEALSQQADLDYGAAECHAILCGLICTTGPTEQEHWLGLLYATETTTDISTDDRDQWQQLYNDSLGQLRSDELGFQLLLPGDEQPLDQRTEAVTDWCRGFLYGISAGQLKLGPEQSDDINEIIRDLTQIASVIFEDSDDSNEDERAYMELCEYIRTGTMLIFSELQTPARPERDDSTLH